MIKETVHKLLNRSLASHKYDYGHVLVIGGSPGMVGAPLLSATAALRMGAGLVTVASTPEVIDKLEGRVPEIMTYRLGDDLLEFIKDRKVSVVVVGPGTKPEFAEQFLKPLGKLSLPVIVDGGALGALAQNQSLLASNFILTPHAGEFTHFDAKDPAEFASQHQLVLVQKGHPTHVFGPNGEKYQNTSGGPALATAGTGDTLTGLIAGIIAQKVEPLAAATTAVYLGGSAGDLAAKDKTVIGVIASDILDYLPAAIRLVETTEL